MSASGIDITAHGGVLVVAPVGDIDLTNAEDLRSAILATLANDRAGVVVDLSRTHYLDSAGIRVLFSVARRLEERRRGFALVAPPGSQVLRLLTIVDIVSRVAIHDTVGAARAHLDAD